MQLLAGNLPSSSLNHLALCNLVNDQEQETWIKRARALGSGGGPRPVGRSSRWQLVPTLTCKGGWTEGYRLHVPAAHIAIGSPDGCLPSLVGDVPAAARESPGQGSIFCT